MSGSNDALTQMLLLQQRNQGRRPSAQARLAEQMMAQLNNPAPIYGAGPAIARVGQGVLAGLMSGMAERDDRAREEAQQQQIIDRQDKREYLNQQGLAEFLGGGAAMPQQAPQMAPQAAPQSAAMPMPAGDDTGVAASTARYNAMPGRPPVGASYREPEWAAGLPPANGRINALPLGGGSAPSAAPQGQPDAFTMAQRALASSNPLIRQMAPLYTAQAARDDTRNNRPPVMVSPGATVLDPNTNRPIFTAPRAPEAPSELDRLMAASGLRPGTPEYQAAARAVLDRRGMPTQINNNVDTRQAPGETRFDQERGKALAEEERAVVASQGVAGQTLRRLDQIEQAAQRFTTGTLSGARITMGQVAAQFGVPDEALRGFGISRDAVASGETIRSLQAQMLQGLIGPGGFPAANFSNADREMLERSLPGLQNSPGGNAAISAILRARSERDMEIANSWNDYSRANGSTYQTFDRWTRDVRPQISNRDIITPILENYQPPAPQGPAPRAPGLADRPRIRNQQQSAPMRDLPPGFEVVQ
jgi:hypothetical protein